MSMRFSRALFVIFLLTLATASWSQSYPAKPIRLLVGFTAGGNADLTARAIAGKLAQALGTTIVVENRAGAAGSVAAGIVARAPADGYTLMLASPGALAVNRILEKNLPYDPDTAFALIGMAATFCNALAARQDYAASSVTQLIALAKEKPGQINFGSQGIGSAGFLSGQLMLQMAGIKLTHVPYKGGADATIAVLGGELHLTFASAAAALALRNRLKVLAVTSLAREPSLPDAPTMDESGLKGYEATLLVRARGARRNAAGYRHSPERAPTRRRVRCRGREAPAAPGGQPGAVLTAGARCPPARRLPEVEAGHRGKLTREHGSQACGSLFDSARRAAMALQMRQYRFGRRNVELAGSFDVDAFDDPVIHDHGVTIRANAHSASGEIQLEPQLLDVFRTTIREHAHLSIDLQVFAPGCHDKGVIRRHTPDFVDPFGFECGSVLNERRHMLGRTGGRIGAGKPEDDDFLALGGGSDIDFLRTYRTSGTFVEACRFHELARRKCLTSCDHVILLVG